MAVNIKATRRFEIDQATDSMGRTWAGWDENATDQVNWDHNRGRHTFGPRVDQERYATISHDGRIRLVVELTGRKEQTNPQGGARKKWSLEGRVLKEGDPIRDAFLGLPAPTGRKTIEYIEDPDLSQTAKDAFLLTNNPARWELDPDELADWVEATDTGHPVEGRWSTGVTTRKIGPGDRAFLLRQGVAGRGIFASGTFISDVFQAEHWDGDGGLANYADVSWDTVLDPADVLPIETLFTELPEGRWEPQASGSQIKAAVVGRLEELWADHVASIRGAAPPPMASSTRLSAGPGRRVDTKLRKEIEDLAQERLMTFYRHDGWKVEDRRIGNPFDAKATKEGETLYLEAKGTVTSGERVIVTRGEIAWAREHPGECVIGILSGVAVKSGSVDPSSGILLQYHWKPEDDDLVPLDYDFYPPPDALISED